MQTILFIEDDADLVNLMRSHITDLGYQFDSAPTGREGLEKALRGEYSLVVLDVMLPELNGLDVCRRVRVKKPALPILMLSAKSEDTDKIVGLELGADDYVTKPFRVQELIARIRALLRRVEAIRETLDVPTSEPTMHFGSLTIDCGKRRVTLENREIELTIREFDLLRTLAAHPERPYTREQLLSSVWDTDAQGYFACVTSMVKRLRAKLKDGGADREYVHTVRGLGYCFRDDAFATGGENDDGEDE